MANSVFQLRKSRVEVQRQNDELNELNATKDGFFGIIAHDIRSPIVALQSVHAQGFYTRLITKVMAKTFKQLLNSHNGKPINQTKHALAA